MSFKEFDLSDYIEALEHFKYSNTDDIVKYWGNPENFDRFIQKIKEDETEVARLAIQHFGSTEKYTEAMKYNLGHFSKLMEEKLTEEAKEIGWPLRIRGAVFLYLLILSTRIRKAFRYRIRTSLAPESHTVNVPYTNSS